MTVLWVCAAATPVVAAGDDARIAVLEQQLHEMQRALAELKSNDGQNAALKDLQRITAAQYAQVRQRMAAQPRP